VDGAFRVGDWRVEPQLNTIADGIRTLHLEPKVMSVLVCLAEHTDEVTTKERLIHAVWPDTFVTDDVLTHAISELRRAFGDDARRPRFILTVPKGGYRLVAPTERAAAAAASARTPELAKGPRLRKLAVAAMVLLGAAMGTAYRLTRPLPAPRVGRSLKLTRSGRVASPVFSAEGFPAVVSDGARAYFSQLVGTNWRLGFVPLAGGEAGDIAVPPEVCGADCEIDDISPDGSALLVRDVGNELESPLWVLPASGGAPRRVGDVAAHAATWSPDGRRIVFAYAEQLFEANGDGSGWRSLVRLPARAFWLRTSPDGGRVRFTLRDPQTIALSLWQVNADGTGLHELLPGWNTPASGCCGNWSADGKYFFFQSIRDGVSSIWALGEKSSSLRGSNHGPTQLTAGPLEFQMPLPSKDGKTIFAVGVQERSEPVRYDARSQQFVPLLPGIATRWLRFSRDGAWIADVGPQGMWRMRADGSQRLQLISPPMYVCQFLNWSPDGARIAFPGKLPGKPLKIYVISRDGGSPVQLTFDDRAETDPDWSPDGSSVVFGRAPEYMAEALMPKDIQIVNVKSGQVSTVPGSEGLFSPHWSPDGRYIAAMPMKRDKLLLFDFVAGRWRELANGPAQNPMWSRDGRYVYTQGLGDIWRVRISDRKVDRVATWDVKELRRGLIGYGLTSLAPDGSPVALMEDAGTDLFAFEWNAP
jgi:DNA-binding winged helix-turn-helix (wHTH) protein/Tol biopolymer transport system component